MDGKIRIEAELRQAKRELMLVANAIGANILLRTQRKDQDAYYEQDPEWRRCRDRFVQAMQAAEDDYKQARGW